jgi:hypothetical protein
MQSSFVPSRNGLTGGSLPLGLPAALPFEMSTMGISALKNYLPPPDEARRLRDIYFRVRRLVAPSRACGALH